MIADSKLGGTRNCRLLLGVWLLVAAIFILSHFDFYFFEPHSEWGDEAANALQIQNAKSFGELYGNYSRWEFHHPGPAFFYAYALGEYLLFDFTRIVPCPSNAHALVGLLIQTFFFAWTIAILRRRVGGDLLVPLVLLAAALHFSAVNFHLRDSAFVSTWPPYVLLFPFLCFLVASASAASGGGRDLIPAATAGALLVHGHVAQPLFVVPIFTAAYLALILGQARARNISRWAVIRSFSIPHLVGGGIIALFLLPICLDAARGEASNLNVILHHFSVHSGERKSAGSSLLYLVSFLCYLSEPERYVDPLTDASWRFLWERWAFVAIWAALLGATIFLTLRSRLAPAPERNFRRALWTMFGMALLLTFVWGMIQNGEMFNFNSYFNFGLIFVLPILFVCEVAHRFRTAHAIVRAGLYAIIVPLLAVCARSGDFRGEFVETSRNMAVGQEIQRAAKATPRSTKLLVFDHKDWPYAAGMALTLERSDCDFAVTERWGFMFGQKHVLELASALGRSDVALWKVKPAGANLHGFPLPEGRFIETSPPTLDPATAEITFSGAHASAGAYAIVGWDLSDGDFSWSDAAEAWLYFEPLPAGGDVEIMFDVFPAVFPNVASQRITVSFNQGPPETFRCAAPTPFTVRVPREIWNRTSPAVLRFDFPDAVAPAAIGVSADPRRLGYGFRKISFRQVTGP